MFLVAGHQNDLNGQLADALHVSNLGKCLFAALWHRGGFSFSVSVCSLPTVQEN